MIFIKDRHGLLFLVKLTILLILVSSFNTYQDKNQNEISASGLDCTLQIYQQVDSIVRLHVSEAEYTKVRDSIMIDYKITFNRETHTFVVKIVRMEPIAIDKELLGNQISKIDHSCMWKTGEERLDSHKTHIVYFSPTTIDNIKNSRK